MFQARGRGGGRGVQILSRGAGGGVAGRGGFGRGGGRGVGRGVDEERGGHQADQQAHMQDLWQSLQGGHSGGGAGIPIAAMGPPVGILPFAEPRQISSSSLQRGRPPGGSGGARRGGRPNQAGLLGSRPVESMHRQQQGAGGGGAGFTSDSHQMGQVIIFTSISIGLQGIFLLCVKGYIIVVNFRMPIYLSCY